MAATTVSQVCCTCSADKPLEEFHRSRNHRNGRNPQCAQCKNGKAAGYYQRWPLERRLKHRQYVLGLRYGLTLEMLEQMYELQEGCCKICGKSGHCPARSTVGRNTTTLHVDHDHVTGEVRGLLCYHCNAGLGHFKEQFAVMARAVAYLAGDDL